MLYRAGLVAVLMSTVSWADPPSISYFKYRQWTMADAGDIAGNLYCQDPQKILRTYEMGNGNPPPDRLQGVNCAPYPDAISDGSFLTSGLTHGQIEIRFNAEPGYTYWVLWKPINIDPPVVFSNGSSGTSWQPISPAITVQSAGEYSFKSGTVEPSAFYRILRR